MNRERFIVRLLPMGRILPQIEGSSGEHVIGYHDIRTGNAPDPRLTDFLTKKLPDILPEYRERFDAYKDLLSAFVSREMDYPEFAARVRRRRHGTLEDHDWEDVDPSNYK
ncbi:MAG: hypothetical protein FJ311_14680 [Rhodospirillales bacterium]|nr:hypothetical protein [Rhodospirillales bacterium]